MQKNQKIRNSAEIFRISSIWKRYEKKSPPTFQSIQFILVQNNKIKSNMKLFLSKKNCGEKPGLKKKLLSRENLNFFSRKKSYEKNFSKISH